MFRSALLLTLVLTASCEPKPPGASSSALQPLKKHDPSASPREPSAAAASTGSKPSTVGARAPSWRVWRPSDAPAAGIAAPRRLGSPRTEQTPFGTATCFDGKADGLVLENNPLAGLQQFTLQVLFRPDADGPAEQRFIHVQETGSESRAMVETRVTPAGTWYLDTFLKSPDDKLPLIDEKLQHPADRWYWAALSYDGQTMRHYVAGKLEGEGKVRFSALGPGRMSLGMRLNEVHWFKGCVAELRVTPRALPAAELQSSP